MKHATLAPRHSTLRFENHSVIKTAVPELMRVEVEKTRRAGEIGRRCGLFRVPEVLGFDEKTGRAVFTRIHGLHPIRSVVGGPARDRHSLELAGRSLAVIHRELTLPAEMTIGLPPEFDWPGSEAYLHGDFNGLNVCLDGESPIPVILDWQTTARHGGRATYGSRYFDLIWFVNYLLWTPTIRYFLGDPVAPLARIFLKAYLKEANLVYDGEALALYAGAFFAHKAPLRSSQTNWRSRPFLPRSRVLTQRFIGSLPGLMDDDNSLVREEPMEVSE